jgi:hypothetical protein
VVEPARGQGSGRQGLRGVAQTRSYPVHQPSRAGGRSGNREERAFDAPMGACDAEAGKHAQHHSAPPSPKVRKSLNVSQQETSASPVAINVGSGANNVGREHAPCSIASPALN